jgi:hypothetical protein
LSNRVYVVSASNITIAGATTLIMLRPGATAAIEILRMWATQSGTSTSGQCRIQAVRQVAVLPTMTTGITPVPLIGSDPVSLIVAGTAVAAGTVGVNASAEGAGTKSVVHDEAFNNLTGFKWIPTPKEQVILSPGAAYGFGLFMPAAPASLTGWAFGMTFRELG